MTRLTIRFAALSLVLALAGVLSYSRLSAQVVTTPPQVGIACAYNTSPPTITTGNYLLAQCDSTGHLLITAGGGSGGSVTQGTSPWVDNITQWGSTTLGAATAVGTEATGNVPTNNSHITNTSIPVTGTFFQSTQPISGPVNVTPTNCSGTITTGGTAQSAIAATATIHGFTLANIDPTTGSGEPVWFSMTTTAAAATAASYPLSAPTPTTYTGLSTYSTPFGFGINTAVSIVAATTGHKFSCTYW